MDGVRGCCLPTMASVVRSLALPVKVSLGKMLNPKLLPVVQASALHDNSAVMSHQSVNEKQHCKVLLVQIRQTIYHSCMYILYVRID